jgi:DNA-binding XRE family transcriptional regulator
MPKKATFSDEQYEHLFEAAKRIRKKFKNQEQMALSLGLTQQSVANLLLGKYKPSIEYARQIANADGRTLDDLVGDPVPGTSYHDTLNRSEFKNLDLCVNYHGSKWSPWTVAAARAGFFGASDVPAPEWEKKLDALERTLEKARKVG